MLNKVKELWKDRHNQLQYAKWLMIYSKPYIGRIALVMSFGLFSTVASLFMVQISKNIIDNATFGNGFVRLLVIYLILMLAMQAFSVMDTLISAVLTEKFSFGIRKQIYDKIIQSHWIDVMKYYPGQQVKKTDISLKMIMTVSSGFQEIPFPLSIPWMVVAASSI